MRSFPTDKLVPNGGAITAYGDSISVTVPLRPFELSVEPDQDPIEITTALRLEFVRLPSVDLAALANKAFRFPKNPTDGYIDGSIYLEHAHHPADVTAINFGSLVGDALEAEFEVELCLEFEGLGDFADTSWRCTTMLKRE